MSFSQRKKEIIFENYLESETDISLSIDDNQELIKTLLKDNDDIVYREFNVGGVNGKKFLLIYIDGMADKNLLNEHVIQPLMLISRAVKPDYDEIKNHLLEVIKTSTIVAADFKELEYVEKAIIAVLSGDSVLFMDGIDKAIALGTRLWPARGVSEPSSETLIRGPRDGFTETIRFNTALVRRRIRDPHFKIKQQQIGLRSKTDIAIMYIEGIVDPRILEELDKKLSNINIDAILESGYIQQMIETRTHSFLPEIQTTERPDTAAASVYEGRVVVLVDNTPFALILPTTFMYFFQSPEDYYVRPIVATVARLIRLVAGFLSVLSPALYVAITSFHPALIPSKLAISIAASREGVPFPAFIEAIIMILTLELLIEAGIRLPRPIGSTIGIVGGLIIGQAAVSAGIVSPIMIIVVAITAVASFCLPNYEISNASRIARMAFLIGASIYGLYGIMLVMIAFLVVMVNIKNFGIPYMSPFAPFVSDDLKDSIYMRASWKNMKKRPRHLEPKNEIRQGDDSNGKG